MATTRNRAHVQQAHAIDLLRRAEHTFRKRGPNRAELLHAGRTIALAVQSEIQLALKVRMAAEIVASGARFSHEQRFASPGEADLKHTGAKIVRDSPAPR